MPIKKSLSEIELPVNGDASDSDEPIDQLEAQEIRALASAIEKFGNECTSARIYRKTPHESKYRYMDVMAVDAVSEDYLAKEFGGGDYEVQFMDSKGKMRTKRRVSIDLRLKGARDLAEPKPATAADAALTTLVDKLSEKADAPASPAGFLEMMQMQFTAQQQAQAAQQQAQQAALVAQREASDKMFQLMMANNQANISMMTAAMSNKPAEPKSPLPELVGLFMPVVLEMIRKKTDGLEDIERIARIKDLFATPEEKEDMIEKIIKYGGPLAAAFLGSRGEQPPQGQQLPPPDTGNAPPLPPPGPSPQIQTFLALILNAARKNSDPTAYAVMIEDGADDATYANLIAVLEKETWFDELFGQLPEFQDHRAWIERLRRILLEDDSEEQDPKLTSDTGR